MCLIEIKDFSFLSELFKADSEKKTQTYSIEFQTATCKEYIGIEFTYPSFEVYSNGALSCCIYFLNNEICSNRSIFAETVSTTMESSFVQTKQKPGEINVLSLQEFNCLQQNGITVVYTVNHILSFFFFKKIF